MNGWLVCSEYQSISSDPVLLHREVVSLTSLILKQLSKRSPKSERRIFNKQLTKFHDESESAVLPRNVLYLCWTYLPPNSESTKNRTVMPAIPYFNYRWCLGGVFRSSGSFLPHCTPVLALYSCLLFFWGVFIMHLLPDVAVAIHIFFKYIATNYHHNQDLNKHTTRM